jgi:hypothetical protein
MFTEGETMSNYISPHVNRPKSKVPQDVLDYLNTTFDIRILITRGDRHSRDTLNGIQLVLDAINNINIGTMED